MALIPVIKRQDEEYDFSYDVKDSKNEKVIKTWYAYIRDAIMVGYSYDTKQWEYHAIREDKKLGLMSWVNSEGTWKQVAEGVAKAYSDCIAEKALLKE